MRRHQLVQSVNAYRLFQYNEKAAETWSQAIHPPLGGRGFLAFSTPVDKTPSDNFVSRISEFAAAWRIDDSSLLDDGIGPRASKVIFGDVKCVTRA